MLIHLVPAGAKLVPSGNKSLRDTSDSSQLIDYRVLKPRQVVRIYAGGTGGRQIKAGKAGGTAKGYNRFDG